MESGTRSSLDVITAVVFYREDELEVVGGGETKFLLASKRCQ